MTSRGWRGLVRAVVGADRRRFALVVAVQFAAAAAQGVGVLLLVPLLHRVGVGNTAADTLTLRGLLGAYVGVVAAAALFSGYASVLQTRYRLEFVDGLRNRLYRAIAAAEWRHLLSVRRSDLMASLTVNVAAVQAGTTALLSLAVALLVVAAQLGVALRIAPGATLLAAATGAVVVASLAPVVRRSRRLGKDLVAANRTMLGSLTGFLDGLRLAKAHGLETSHVDEFRDALARTRGAQTRFAVASAVATGVPVVATAAVLAVVVDVAIERLHLDVARLLVVAFVFSRIVPQLTSAQRNIQQIAQAVPAFDDVLECIAACHAAADGVAPGPARPVELRHGIRLTGVTFRYPGTGRVALDDVSLTIAARQTTAIVGPSGAGKTTLADVVVGLLPPDAGEITVDGVPPDLSAWRASLALVPQEPFLWNVSIADNLRWAAPGATDDELWAALATAAADRFVAALPDGLATVVGDRGVRVSGGERQRIALARALLRHPTLLVLDEATSSLDTENERAIRDALTALNGELTMLVIAHRLSTVNHADLIVVLDAGRVVETGTWAQLSRRRSGRLRSLIDAGALR